MGWRTSPVLPISSFIRLIRHLFKLYHNTLGWHYVLKTIVKVIFRTIITLCPCASGVLASFLGFGVIFIDDLSKNTNTMLSRTTAALQWVRDSWSTELLFLTGRSTEFLFLDIRSTELLFLTGPEMAFSIFRPPEHRLAIFNWLEHRISIFNLATVDIFYF